MNRIKEILQEKGITLNELASRLGVTRVTLSAQINGTANIASYERIAKALNVPLASLFTDSKKIFTAFVEYNGEIKKFTDIDTLYDFLSEFKKADI